MPLPWFKVATSLPTHPKLLELAAAVPGCDPVGIVVRLWAWVAMYYPNGKIPARMESQVERAVTGYVTVTGLVTAMLGVGLLERYRDSLIVHDWDVEQGEHVNMQERNRAKQRAFRERNRLRNRDVTGGVTGSEERRGEEIREDPPVVVTASPDMVKGLAAEKPAAPVRKRTVASPEQLVCRKALTEAFDQAFTQHSQGKVYLWQAADRKAIQTICNSVGNVPEEAIRLLATFRARAAGDHFMSANFSPRFIASRLNSLRTPLLASAPRPEKRPLGSSPARTLEEFRLEGAGRKQM